MYVADDKFCMICHPKTGTKSCRDALKDNFSVGTYKGQHGIEEPICRRILDSGGIVCSTVRNPFDVVVSWYFYHHVRRLPNKPGTTLRPFDKWLPEEFDRPTFILSRKEEKMFYGTHLCNHIIRFEDGLADGFNQALARAGMGPVEVPHRGVVPRKPYKEMYDARTIALVVDRFGDEIENWGYQF